MMCVCGADSSYHVMSNNPWVKPGKAGQYCTVPMCSCIQMTPVEVEEDFFSDYQEVTKDILINS